MHDHGSRFACLAHHRQAFGDFTLPGAEPHYPPDLGIEPIHLDIDLAIDIAAARASGTVTHTLIWRRAGARTLELDAVDLQIATVEDPGGNELRWRHDGRKLRVTWTHGAERDATRKLAIRYAVERPAAGLYFSTSPRYAITDHETERARHWLPTIDLPSVRPKLAFHLRAPAELTVLANGLLVTEDMHDDGSKTAHWRLEQPCPSYLTCFAIGEFVRLDDGDHQGVELAYFCTPEHGPDHLSRSFGGTSEIMRWMTEKLGAAFPFPKYYQFAVPRIGGAMENISLVSWDDQFLLDEPLSGEWGRLVDQINVHEMAHSWFGDRVVCRDYAHAWLKESWATYMEVCWFEYAFGRDEQLYELWLNAESYFREADTRYQRPIVTRKFHSSMEMYDMHLYPGGAARLHTLRCMLGDELFWEGVRAYLREYDGKLVETDDFRRAMERASGRSLGKFFDQWFHGPGYPALEVEFEHDDEDGVGRFTIKQTQVDATAGIGAFEFPLGLSWTIDGTTHRRTVTIERERHVFAFDMARDPEQVRVDPEAELLHKLDFDPGTDKLEQQLRDAPDVIGRILAGRELAKQGKPSAIAIVQHRWKAERFWGVRVEWAKALGRSGSTAAIAALIHAIDHEQDHRVLEGLLRAGMEIRDAGLAAAVESRLGRGLPHRAAMVAWELLGAQREAAPFEAIAAASGRASYNGFAQSGALRALASTRDDRALDVLLERTRIEDVSDRARPAAVASLGQLARRLDKRPRERAIERLIDLLRDPTERVRQTAVHALASARAVDAIAELEGYRGRVSVQEAVGVAGVIAELRKGEEPRIAAAEKELEDLREKLRKLEGRIETLDGKAGSE
ncbi:M1 family aminopeptidase [Nannocystaceae bacterium ST9]